MLRSDPSAFDVVVSDYNMPYLSGLDVARAVRDIRADLPVAIVSGFIDERLLHRPRMPGSGN
jgi:CheY-like chemotaxis protein